VLDDCGGGFFERLRETDGGIEVEEVVVRKLFALDLFEGVCVFRDVEGGGLLGVFAVAQVLEFG
jgi:hypothetical protein